MSIELQGSWYLFYVDPDDLQLKHERAAAVSEILEFLLREQPPYCRLLFGKDRTKDLVRIFYQSFDLDDRLKDFQTFVSYLTGIGSNYQVLNLVKGSLEYISDDDLDDFQKAVEGEINRRAELNAAEE